MKMRCGERHHIKPRSLFPDLIKEPSNIIKLTYREHYVCHWLLYNIYRGLNDKNAIIKMAFAWVRMCTNTDGTHVSSRDFAIARRALGEALSLRTSPNKGKHLSEEHRQKLREANLGKKLGPRSDDVKQKISNALKGRPGYMKGKHHSEETKHKISELRKEANNPFFGRCHSEESKRKMKECAANRKWWNNGIEETLCKDCPGIDWKQGRLGK